MNYELNESNETFCCVFLYCAMLRGNQHGGREYDDLQNWLHMTSHEKPSIAVIVHAGLFLLQVCICVHDTLWQIKFACKF